MNKRFENVWDALIDDPVEASDLKKRSDYLTLIRARLNGLSGSETDKAMQFGLPFDQVRDLIEGKINKFSLAELIAIARKIGITIRV